MLTPILPPFAMFGVGAEVPGGTINGSNVVFTLAATPALKSLQLYLNGLLQKAGAGLDYTLAGATVTMSLPPESGDVLTADYWKA